MYDSERGRGSIDGRFGFQSTQAAGWSTEGRAQIVQPKPWTPRAWHLRRLAQFLLALARGDGAGRRRPSPRTRPRTTAPWTAGCATTGSPLLRRPRRSARGRRPSSLPAPPRPPPCSQGDHARPSTTTAAVGGALQRPRRLLSRPQPLRPQESRMDWGYVLRFWVQMGNR